MYLETPYGSVSQFAKGWFARDFRVKLTHQWKQSGVLGSDQMHRFIWLAGSNALLNPN